MYAVDSLQTLHHFFMGYYMDGWVTIYGRLGLGLGLGLILGLGLCGWPYGTIP